MLEHLDAELGEPQDENCQRAAMHREKAWKASSQCLNCCGSSSHIYKVIIGNQVILDSL